MTRRPRARFLGRLNICLIWGLCTACESTPPALELPVGCNPLLAGVDCMLPFPSDFFLVADDSLPSRRRVALTGAAMMESSDGEAASIYSVETVDGFSLTPPILTVVGDSIAREGLNTILGDPNSTTTIKHATLLIHSETLELIPHFVDLDPRAVSPERQALVIRPLVGLDEQTRYIVVLHGLENLDGEVVSAPEGFRRIRDKKVRGDPQLEPLAKRYEKELFPVLKELSLERTELQLAWDFTTGSLKHVQGDMLTMRDLIIGELKEREPEVEITSVDMEESGDVWKTIHGRITVPLVLDSHEPGGILMRDADGEIILNGTVRVPFIAVIPHSLRQSTVDANIIQYGHGFFGTRFETTKIVKLANDTKSIAFGVDWWGFSQSDIATSIDNLGGDLKNALLFSKRIYQGMANWLTLSKAIETSLKGVEVFQREDGSVLYNSQEMAFVGMSQGAILGGTYCALNPSISKAVLHVGGVALSHMMFRSDPFARFLFVLDLSLPDPLDQQKFAALLQPVFDRFDPSTYAPFIVNQTLSAQGQSEEIHRKILMQVALADTQVPNFSSFLYGRLAGVPLIEPSPIDIFGMVRVLGPHEGSGMVVSDLGEDPTFALEAKPPGELNNVHSGLRNREFSLRQMREFLLNGVIAP